MEDNVKKYIIRFSAPGYAVEFQYLVSAASRQSAEIIWADYLLQDKRIRQIWSFCQKNCCGYTVIEEDGNSPFPSGYCEELEWKHFSLGTDHRYD